MPINAQSHYNHVTDAWKEFMGDHLHFGYFETEDMDITRASETMIEKMLELCDISESTRILDVGCGIGGPAIYIHERFNCAIDGITTSERGVQIASATSEEKGYQDVRFKVADGINNGFPDNTFDIVWIMEATHLIADKRSLFKECFRVLKEGGTLVLCDLTQLAQLPMHKGLWHFISHGRQYYHLMRTWGPAQVISLGTYCDRIIDAGFHEVTAIDITAKTLPTMRSWRENALRFKDREIRDFSKEDVDGFIYGCEIVDSFYKTGLYGYGMIRAIK
jgi:27-O-demethylrifamycin SV methyltransferase